MSKLLSAYRRRIAFVSDNMKPLYMWLDIVLSSLVLLASLGMMIFGSYGILVHILLVVVILFNLFTLTSYVMVFRRRAQLRKESETVYDNS